MIVFNVKSDGTVDTLPSIVPQASSLADIVILSAYDYAYCYLHLTPPSGVYIPDVVCTPVLTTDRKVTLWTAPMPAEAVKIGGFVEYQIYFKAADGTEQLTMPGTFPVPRTVISTVDKDGNVVNAEDKTVADIYQVIADIYQAFVSLDREMLTHYAEIYGVDISEGALPDYNAPSRIDALDERVTANAEDIADNAERIETNADNHLQLWEELYGEGGDIPDIRATLTEHGGQIENLMGDVADNREGLNEVRSDLANFLDVDDDTRDQLSEVLSLISANEQAIKQFVSMGGAPVGSGTLVVPKDQWSDETPTGAMVALPANTMGAGSVMLLTPANDATKEAASKARLTVSVDISGDSGGNLNDYVVLLRAETAYKPEADMEFAFVILQTTAETSLVTLIGVDAAGDPEPTEVDLSGFEDDGTGKGVIKETYADGTVQETEVIYDEAGNIIKIGNTAINWGGEA